MNREPVTIDGATGLIIEDGPHRLRSSDASQHDFGTDQSGNTGFGQTRKFLDSNNLPGAPWMTPELAEQEMQIAGLK